MTGLPAASCHMTYPGDVTHIVGEVKGQNALGEWLTAVEATYDADADTTRVGFAIGVHGDFLESELEQHTRWRHFLTALHRGALR